MKFKFLLKKSITVALIIFTIIMAVCFGFICYRLAVFGPDAFSIVSITISLIFFVLAGLILFNTHYVFSEDELKVCLGVMTQHIKYNDIVAIKNYIKHKEMFIIFRPNKQKEEGDLTQILINIKPELYTDFVEELKRKNSMIMYDEINQDLSETDEEKHE